jgi:signal transduction histidine kinase
VTQTLFSASLIAETLPRSWERDQEKGRRLLQELRQLSRGALAEMRTLLLELRPAALVETSLSDLLRQLGEAASGRGGVPVKVMVEGACALSPDVHIALYRIVQEALNNAVKHARAGQVTVRLRCTPYSSVETEQRQRGQVELIVRDDGRGFNPSEVPPDHLGLGIMRERAEAIGATLEIESGPGYGPGTQIQVTWKVLDKDGG